MVRILFLLAAALVLSGADRIVHLPEYPTAQILKLAQNRAELQGTKPRDTLLVSFGANYCSPCKVEDPHVRAYAKEYSWTFVYIDDSDGDPKIDALLDAHKVTGLPTYIVFHAGHEVYRAPKRRYKVDAKAWEIKQRVRAALLGAHRHIN